MLTIMGMTNQGKVRQSNQDAFAYRILGESSGYAIVCDGMGGEKAGDVASSTACQLIAKFLTRDITLECSEAAVKAVIFSAVSAANAKVYSMAKETPDYAGMGTTLVLIVVAGESLHLVNIGDSRIYMAEQDPDQSLAVRQLTHDHTVVQGMIDRGEINQEQASIHPQRHLITRAIGVSDRIDIDYQFLNFPKESRILLCTDGLSSYLKQEELPALLKSCSAEQSTQPLIDFANNQGGCDNITAVVVSH